MSALGSDREEVGLERVSDELVSFEVVAHERADVLCGLDRFEEIGQLEELRVSRVVEPALDRDAARGEGVR